MPGPSSAQANAMPTEADSHVDHDDDAHDGFEERETPDFLPSNSGVFAKGNLFAKPPTRVDEPASLAMIQPVSVGATLALPRETMLQFLAQHQLLAVWYIMNQHALMLPNGKRCGFFLGDGPGVGKTRVVGAVIFENFIRRGTKALWLSANMDLMRPAQRDLCRIGAGRLRCVAGTSLLKTAGGQEADIMFATYKMLSTRVQEVVAWLTSAFDGVIVLDECHLAKNLAGVGSLAAKAVAALQDQLPQARVIYVSATGASQPAHFCNMSRLGLWGQGTAFPSDADFIKQMEADDIRGMQLVASHMKERGQYLARILSLDGCSFQIVHAGVSDEFRAMYDRCAKLWDFLEDNLHDFQWHEPQSTRCNMNRYFYGTHRLFFHYLLIAAKVPEVVALTRRSLDAGYACIIGLQKTGQAGITAQEGVDDGLVSSAEVLLRRFIEKYYKPAGAEAQAKVLQQVKDLRLPPNPLDDIIDQLGGHTKVAEITARRERMERRSKLSLVIRHHADGSASSSTRAKDETWVSVPRQETKASALQSFQDGTKMTAILSDAGGVGIGLHSDPLCGNQAKRMHIMMELPDTAEKLVQQIGRSHRSNEVTPPELVLVMTELGGDRKSSAMIARRMQAMGALTQGDRRSSGQLGGDFFDLGIDDGPGSEAARSVAFLLNKGSMHWRCPIEPPSVVREAFSASAAGKLWDDFANAYDSKCWLRLKRLKGTGDAVVTFFNCLMGATVTAQRHIYAVFSACLEHLVSEARRTGQAAANILDVAGSDLRVDATHPLWTCPDSGAVTKHVCVSTDRGLDFAAAEAMLAQHPEQTVSGFYVPHRQRAGQTPQVVLVLARHHHGTGGFKLEVFRPNTGRMARGLALSTIRYSYMKVAGVDEVKAHWQELREYYRNRCGHKPGMCKDPKTCKFKTSRIQHDMITGSLLPFWQVLGPGKSIVRVEPSCGHASFLAVPVMSAELAKVCNKIREGGPFSEAMLRRAVEGRLAVSPLFTIEAVVALKRLVSVEHVDEVAFQLPHGWRAEGKQCVAVLYEMPAVVDVDADEVSLFVLWSVFVWLFLLMQPSYKPPTEEQAAAPRRAMAPAVQQVDRQWPESRHLGHPQAFSRAADLHPQDGASGRPDRDSRPELAALFLPPGRPRVRRCPPRVAAQRRGCHPRNVGGGGRSGEPGVGPWAAPTAGRRRRAGGRQWHGAGARPANHGQDRHARSRQALPALCLL